MPSPITSLRSRFGAAIDWRVRDALIAHLPPSGAASEADRLALVDEMKVLRSSITEISASLAGQLRSLEDLAEQLDRRVSALERARD